VNVHTVLRYKETLQAPIKVPHSTVGSYTYAPSPLVTKLDRAITMTRFRVDGIFLFVPTGETERCREHFDTFGEAISASYQFIRDLHNDPGVPTIQTDSWTDLTGQRDENGVEEIFGCHFSVGAAGVVQGMILVTALHEHTDEGG